MNKYYSLNGNDNYLCKRDYRVCVDCWWVRVVVCVKKSINRLSLFIQMEQIIVFTISVLSVSLTLGGIILFLARRKPSK